MRDLPVRWQPVLWQILLEAGQPVLWGTEAEGTGPRPGEAGPRAGWEIPIETAGKEDIWKNKQ